MNFNNASSAEMVVSCDLWHARLGHVGFSSIKNTMHLGLIPKSILEHKTWEVCVQPKYAKKTFKSVDRKSDLLELIHSDICELNNVLTRGKRYFVTFIDDFCRIYPSLPFET